MYGDLTARGIAGGRAGWKVEAAWAIEASNKTKQVDFMIVDSLSCKKKQGKMWGMYTFVVRTESQYEIVI